MKVIKTENTSKKEDSTISESSYKENISEGKPNFFL